MPPLRTQPDRPSAAPPIAFAYGGVVFEVQAAPDLGWELSAGHRALLAPPTEPTVATVHCAFTRAPSDPGRHGERDVTWEWRGGAATVRAGGASAVLRELGEGRYVASGRLSRDEEWCGALLDCIAPLLVDRRGGLSLHATGVELDGHGLLFIGPSGAGKSTAAALTGGGGWIACDRAVAYPVDGRWYASGIFGGDEPEGVGPARARTLPLAGILRVRRGSTVPEVAGYDRASAAVALRESILSPPFGVEAEMHLLELVASLSSAVPIAELRTVLGMGAGAVVRRWLDGATR